MMKKKKYEVWIYDSESRCTQPIICEARSEAEAGRIGHDYIRKWGLIDGRITEVKEVNKLNECTI